MDIKKIFKSATGADLPMDLEKMATGKMDLPLDDKSMGALNELIGKGAFNDKQDFMSFLVKAYMQNKMGGVLSSGKPSESSILDIVNKAGVGKNISDGDKKSLLVPLLITAFTMIYKMMSAKKTEMRPA